MGDDLKIWGASKVQINLYYFFVLLSFIYILYKYRKSPFSIYIILLFFTGLVSAFGKNIYDVYKICLFVLSIYWVFRTRSVKVHPQVRYLILFFLLFSIAYFLTSYINDDYFLIIFSQYSRFIILLACLLIFYNLRNDNNFKHIVDCTIFDLLTIQIFLSIVKFVIMGPRESLVGSITSQGGSAATLLPILGFIFLWIKNKGRLTRQNWIFVFGLLLIGFVGAKRAVWFVMPAIIALFIFYVSKKGFSVRNLFLSFIVGIAIVYMGLRVTPTLNPEHKIWGRFDWEFAMNYVDKYSYGNKDNPDEISGRNSTTNFVVDKFVEGDITIEDWFGYGLRYAYATDYDEFAELGFYTKHKGSSTGLFQTLISNGYVGVITLILFVSSLISVIRDIRFRIVVLLFVLWEYFYYSGTLLKEYALFFLLIYIVVFADTSRQVVVRNDCV